MDISCRASGPRLNPEFAGAMTGHATHRDTEVTTPRFQAAQAACTMPIDEKHAEGSKA